MLIDEYLERIRCARPFLEGTDEELPKVCEADAWWCIVGTDEKFDDQEDVILFASKDDAECWSDGYNMGLLDTPRRIDQVCSGRIRASFDDGVSVHMYDKRRAVVVLRQDRWVPCTALGAPAWVGRKKFEQIVEYHGENRTAQYFNCSSFEEAKARSEAYDLLERIRACRGNTLPIAIEIQDLPEKIEAALSTLDMSMSVNDVLSVVNKQHTRQPRRPRDDVDVKDLVSVRRVA